MADHDSLDSHDTGPSEVETQVEKVSADQTAELERLMIAAHIEGDTVNVVMKVAGPFVRALVAKLLAP